MMSEEDEKNVLAAFVVVFRTLEFVLKQEEKRLNQECYTKMWLATLIGWNIILTLCLIQSLR